MLVLFFIYVIMSSVLTKERTENLLAFCKAQGMSFNDLTLLDQAFHHRSLINEQKSAKNNERLEFLGDSVLGMVTAAYLYRTLENPEGDLAKIKSAVVSEKALAPVALSIGVDTLLLMGHGEERTGGRTKPAILADCMEAIIGAYYLDSGYKKSEEFVLSFIKPEVDKVLEHGMRDFKTQLQEKYQKTHKAYPVYSVVLREGPEHRQTFYVTVTLGDAVFGPAKGSSKKEAEQAAAKIALDSI